MINSQQVYGKQTKLIFKTTGNETVTIYTPIDNSCNFYKTPSGELTLSPDIEVTYKPKISGFSFVQIRYSTGKRYSLLLFEGDSLQLNYDRKEVYFSGDNAAGQHYLNTFNRRINVDSVFKQNINGYINFKAIQRDIKSLFFDGLNSDINQLKSDGKITSDFGQKVYNDMNYAVNRMFIESCNKLLYGVAGVKLTKVDTMAITKAMDSVFVTVAPENNVSLQYRYSDSYLSNYYFNKYNKLTANEKSKLLNGFTENTFGPFAPFLLAPDYIQCPYLGFAFLVQLDFAVNEFDKSSMYNYLQYKFPDSEYLKIIKGRYLRQKKEENISSKPLEKKVIYLTQSIKSLKELSSLPELKNKDIFIDIWATWCIPCKMQFQYKEKLESLASIYDVTILYISIDNEDSRKKWTSDIEELELNGYHLLANKDLINDIHKNVYQNTTIVIPRYVLIDRNGHVVNNDLPRPESIDLLREVFEKDLK